MSDLENQVETAEELVAEKAPTDMAEKGDKSAHKQVRLPKRNRKRKGSRQA